MDALPSELLTHLLSLVDSLDLIRARFVCSTLKAASRQPQVIEAVLRQSPCLPHCLKALLQPTVQLLVQAKAASLETSDLAANAEHPVSNIGGSNIEGWPIDDAMLSEVVTALAFHRLGAQPQRIAQLLRSNHAAVRHVALAHSSVCSSDAAELLNSVGSICWNDHPTEIDKVANTLRSGCVGSTVLAMRRLHSWDVQEAGCFALGAVCVPSCIDEKASEMLPPDFIVEAVLEASAFAAVVRAITLHPGNRRVLTTAMYTLSWITNAATLSAVEADRRQAARQAIDAGVLGVMQKALVCFAACLADLEVDPWDNAFITLENLCDLASDVKHVLEEPALPLLPTLVRCINAWHTDDEPLSLDGCVPDLEAGVRVVQKLAGLNDSLRQGAIAAGALPQWNV